MTTDSSSADLCSLLPGLNRTNGAAVQRACVISPSANSGEPPVTSFPFKLQICLVICVWGEGEIKKYRYFIVYV